MTVTPDRGFSFRKYGLRWWEQRELIRFAKLPTALKVLLLIMWDAEGRESGLITLTTPRLAVEAGLGERKARRYLKELRALGLLHVERAGGGRNRPNFVRIRWDRLIRFPQHHNEKTRTGETEFAGSAAADGVGKPDSETHPAMTGFDREGGETPSDPVENPVRFGAKPCPTGSETLPNRTEDHVVDHIGDHVEGSQGERALFASPEKSPTRTAAEPLPTVEEVKTAIVATGEALGGDHARRAVEIAEAFVRDLSPQDTEAALRELARAAGVERADLAASFHDIFVAAATSWIPGKNSRQAEHDATPAEASA
ncbi:MAG: hypothetical protein ACOY3Y_19920 [Acidobacteriota bacterium]